MIHTSDNLSCRTFGLTALVLRLAVFVALVFAFGCDQHPKRMGTDYSIFLDRSTSISDESKARYLDHDLAQILETVGPNDRIALYGVHALTASAQPIIEAELPPSSGEGMNEQMRYQRARKKVVTDVADRAREFLAGPIANQTDLLGAFNRLPSQGRRQRVVVFMSDMQHSTRDFDMERIPLTPRTSEASMAAAAKRYRWAPDLLQNVEVRCHLDIPATPADPRSASGRNQGARGTKNRRGPVNNRQALEAYWTTLIRSLGGTVSHFDNADFRAPEAKPAVDSSGTGSEAQSDGVASALEYVRRLF